MTNQLTLLSYPKEIYKIPGVKTIEKHRRMDHIAKEPGRARRGCAEVCL